DVGNVATYTDKTAVSGTKYTYTVRCIGSDGSYKSAYDTTGITVTYIAAPVLKSVTGTSTGVTVTWTKSKGATNYRVFRKEGTGSWKKMADVGNVATYTDKTAVSGTKYTYTVRCISTDGKTYMSAYDTTGKTITYKK
ncbi:MAG: hypothetical protein J6Z24_08490, partial [Oscillospiraceae bacterium]|nr:hypothetical protein [Oscillospiraceae bacterium]